MISPHFHFFHFFFYLQMRHEWYNIIYSTGPVHSNKYDELNNRLVDHFILKYISLSNDYFIFLY